MQVEAGRAQLEIGMQLLLLLLVESPLTNPSSLQIVEKCFNERFLKEERDCDLVTYFFMVYRVSHEL